VIVIKVHRIGTAAFPGTVQRNSNVKFIPQTENTARGDLSGTLVGSEGGHMAGPGKRRTTFAQHFGVTAKSTTE
jgi:hypothetical protein